MPRTARAMSQSGMYHVVLRSVNQQQIFEDAADYQKCLYLLSDACNKYRCSIYAYCLMSNHIHLIINVKANPISAFMQSFTTRFVIWYNKKYKRYGHLFQERFHSTPIENEAQLLQAIFYVHNNPVKAGMCRFMSDYYWSSIRAYLGATDTMICLEEAVLILGSLNHIRHFMTNYKYNEEVARMYEAVETPKLLVEEAALSVFHEVTNCKSPSDFQRLPKLERHELLLQLRQERLSFEQISRFSGTSRTTIHRLLKSCKNL